jgi:hypothetical protein
MRDFVHARIGMASVLARRTREGSITPEQRDRSLSRFHSDLVPFEMVALGLPVIDRAASLALIAPADAPLRALDAIHLASALLVFENTADDVAGGSGLFITSDRQLLRSAQYAGLRVLNPESEPD